LKNKWKDVLCPRETHCASNKKKILFPSSFWGIFFFFLSVSIILESLKKNKRMLRYKGGTSVTNILVLGVRTRLMFRARTFRKIPLGPKVSRHKGKVLQGLRIRHASDDSVESNMESTLDQRRRYATAVNKTHNGNVLRCNFNEPREGKLDGFSYLESLKKRKRRFRWGTFFEDSLVGSKKG
jgi:hypothetical protein